MQYINQTYFYIYCFEENQSDKIQIYCQLLLISSNSNLSSDTNEDTHTQIKPPNNLSIQFPYSIISIIINQYTPNPVPNPSFSPSMQQTLTYPPPSPPPPPPIPQSSIKYITIPRDNCLEQTINFMTQDQINFNILELNLLSLSNANVLDKICQWSQQTKFYLKNRYILQKLINEKSLSQQQKKHLKLIFEKYDQIFVNGIISQNNKQKYFIQYGFNKQIKAQFISGRQQFTATLNQISNHLQSKSSHLNQQDLLNLYRIELNKINHKEIVKDFYTKKKFLLKKPQFSSQQQPQYSQQILSQQQLQSQQKCIFLLPFKNTIHEINKISIQTSKYIKTKNRSPLILDLGINKFLYKIDEQISHQIISMYLIKYLNKIITSQYIIQYQIIPQAHGAFYQFIENSLTIHQIKNKYKYGIVEYINYLQSINKQKQQFKLSKIRKKFVQTYSGFCLIQYLLDLKDRNNSNIMIKNDGSIFHIDLSFIFNSSPGGIHFENTPFKFTKQYLDVMGGYQSDYFRYYQSLMLSNMAKLTMNRQQYLTKIKILGSRKQEIACFKKFNIQSYENKIPKNQNNVQQLIQKLISQSYDSWRTKKYDDYQFNKNHILS